MDSSAPQYLRRLDVDRIGDRLMGGPHPVVGGDGLPVAEHLHLVQIGADQDAAADRARVHRVVVTVEADVVIARQPQR